MKKAKAKSKELLGYEDNLGNNELNINLISDQLIELLGEGFFNELYRLFESLHAAPRNEGSLDSGAEKHLC